jgi:hypothetical protein
MYNINEKNIQKKVIFHQMRQFNFLGRGDFGGSVGKGKQTKFYFRPCIGILVVTLSKISTGRL